MQGGGGGGGGGGKQQTIINSVILHIPFKVLAGTSLCTIMQACTVFIQPDLNYSDCLKSFNVRGEQ